MLAIAICDTEYMQRQVKILTKSKIDIDGIDTILYKFKIVISTNMELVTNITEHMSVVKNKVAGIRCKLIEHLKFCLEKPEQTEEDLEKHKKLLEKNKKQIAFCEKSVRIDQLKRILLKELYEAMNLYNETIDLLHGKEDDWRDELSEEPIKEVDYVISGKKTRRLSRSC